MEDGQYARELTLQLRSWESSRYVTDTFYRQGVKMKWPKSDEFFGIHTWLIYCERNFVVENALR